MLDQIVMKSVVAGLLASLACGLGALPLLLRSIDPERHTGIGYAFACGLMFAASVYNLILPGLSMGTETFTVARVTPVMSGILLGALFLSLANRYIESRAFDYSSMTSWGGRSGVLIFIAMSVHSIPEGVAVGVGYASEGVYEGNLGFYIALAIAVHNIPEGLAVSIPLRSSGVSIPRCFFAAFLTSLPQPIAAVPAAVFAWFFKPLMPLLMGFAAGAMIFLVVLELLPDAYEREKKTVISWSFVIGFCAMLFIQVLL